MEMLDVIRLRWGVKKTYNTPESTLDSGWTTLSQRKDSEKIIRTRHGCSGVGSLRGSETDKLSTSC
jgi:hypothetical protein